MLQSMGSHEALVPSRDSRARTRSPSPRAWRPDFPGAAPGLISFRMDWLDLLAVPGTLKSLLQHHSSKASILWCSAFFTVQLSHSYMTTGKTIAWLEGNTEVPGTTSTEPFHSS